MFADRPASTYSGGQRRRLDIVVEGGLSDGVANLDVDHHVLLLGAFLRVETDVGPEPQVANVYGRAGWLHRSTFRWGVNVDNSQTQDRH